MLQAEASRCGLGTSDSYDERLVYSKVEELLPVVTDQLARRRVTAIAFYAQPRSTTGWGPYYDVLERACQNCQIPLHIEPLGPGYL